MEAFIRNRGLPPIYQCDAEHNWTDLQWSQQGTSRPILGIVNLIFGIFCITLYIPCLFVMMQKELRCFIAYKLLFLITLCEMYGLYLNSILSGIFFIKGTVFCNYPHFIYLHGCGSLLTWTGTCCCCCVLGFTRLVDLWSPKRHDKMFKGKRSILSLIFIFVYMGYFYLFANPIVFNSREMSWGFDPLVYTNGSHVMDYVFFSTIYNNEGTVTVTVLLNFVFVVSFIYKSVFFGFKLTTVQKQMFVQSAFTSFNAFMAASIFVSYLFINGGLVLNYLGLLFWQFSTANDLILFYGINATMREGVIKLITGLIKRNKQIVIHVRKMTISPAETNC